MNIFIPENRLKSMLISEPQLMNYYLRHQKHLFKIVLRTEQGEFSYSKDIVLWRESRKVLELFDHKLVVHPSVTL